MCLAIPAKITEVRPDGLADADILGVARQISVDLTPQAAVGDYVLVHAGFAIEVVDEQFAQETIDLIRQFPELAADDLGAAGGEGDASDAGMAGMGATAGPGIAGGGLAAEFAATFGDVPTKA